MLRRSGDDSVRGGRYEVWWLLLSALRTPKMYTMALRRIRGQRPTMLERQSYDDFDVELNNANSLNKIKERTDHRQRQKWSVQW